MTLEEIQKEIVSSLDETDQKELGWFLYHLHEDRESTAADLEGVEEAWNSEISRRIADIDEGRVKTIPWEVVKKELEERSQHR